MHTLCLSAISALSPLEFLLLMLMLNVQVVCDFVEKMDHYERLGVDRDADDRTLKVRPTSLLCWFMGKINPPC